jgi:hypothetical protein
VIARGARRRLAFSGVLSTVNQLAIAVGIAATATVYQSAHPSGLPAISLTLLTLATVQAITATVVAVALKPRPTVVSG